MTDTETPTPTPTRTRTNVLPAELRAGDQIRDCGRYRTVAATPPQPGQLDIVDVPLLPEGDYPTSLGIPAHQHITVWT